NIIKDPNAPKVKKKGLDNLFSKMMPKSAEKLPISKMNMLGMGSRMIQHVMKNKRVDSLTEMIQKAEDLGIKMVACSMSMDVMASDRRQLLPSVEAAGVVAYLGDADEGNVNLFVSIITLVAVWDTMWTLASFVDLERTRVEFFDPSRVPDSCVELCLIDFNPR